jgi:hypothetical protein
MSARKREYRLFGLSRVGPFSVQTYDYGRGTHLWVIDVYATTVAQAYTLASRGIWARDARSLGVREVYHRGAPPERAPYLRELAA